MNSSTFQKAGTAIFWNIVFFPIIQFVSFATSVLIVRSLAIEEYATYALFLSLSLSLLMYTDFGMTSSLPKFLSEIEHHLGKQGVIRFVKRIISVKILLIVITIIVLNVTLDFWGKIFRIEQHGALILRSIGFILVFKMFSSVGVSILNSFFEQKRSNLLKLTSLLLYSFFVLLFIILGYGIRGVIYGILIAELIQCGLTLFLSCKLLTTLKAPVAESSQSHRFGRRFIRHALFQYFVKWGHYCVSPAFSLVILTMLMDKPEVALFALATEFTYKFIGLLSNPLNNIQVPLFANIYAQSDVKQLQQAATALSKMVLLLFIPAGVGLFVLSANLIELLYPASYVGTSILVKVLIVFLFLETILVNPMDPLLRTNEKYKSVILSKSVSFLNIPLLLLLIKLFGTFGAVISLGFVRLFSGILLLYFAFKFFHLNFPARFFFKVTLSSIICGVGIYWLNKYYTVSYVSTILLMCLGAILFFISLKILGGLGNQEKAFIASLELPCSKYIMKVVNVIW